MVETKGLWQDVVNITNENFDGGFEADAGRDKRGTG